MDDYQRHLDAFLRSLESIEYVRFNGMIGRKHVTGPDEGSPLTWDQWKKNDIVGIVALKQGNAAFWIMVCRAFPKSSDGQALLKHLFSITDNDLLSFYREITGNKAVAYLGQRPDFTLEILDCEHDDPSRWDHAMRLAGIAKPETQQNPQQEEIANLPPGEADESDLRRDRVWHYYYKSLLTEEYWAKKVTLARKRIQFRDIAVIVSGILLAGGLGAVGAGWLARLVPIIATIAVEIFFRLSKRSDLAIAESAKSGWSEIAHDLDELWREGEHRSWDSSVDNPITKYSERIRAAQAAEVDAQDDDLVNECHHVINRRLDVRLNAREKQRDV